MEYDGNAPPEGYLKSLQFVFSDDKMVFTSTPPNGPTNKSEFSYKLDPTTKPKSLDVSPVDGPDKGKFGAAIYDLDGDTLKLCLPRGATKERPTEFRSPQGSQHGYFVLKRIKP
jgi:uncharacterized protein (TIGR03067 family)